MPGELSRHRGGVQEEAYFNAGLLVSEYLAFDTLSTPKEKILTFSRKIRDLFVGVGGI